MRKYIVSFFVFILITAFIIGYRIPYRNIAHATPFSKIESYPNFTYESIKDLNDQQYKNAFITLLYPYVDKSISDYYKKNFNLSPNTDPFGINILNIKTYDEQKFTFEVTVEVLPYIGPHNSVGRDRITLKIQPVGEPVIEKFEHIESYKIIR